MTSLIRKRIQILRKNEAGVAALEFAFAGPIFLTLIFGIMDFGYSLYIRSVLQGSVEDAGRLSTLENRSTSVIDNKVKNDVGTLGQYDSITTTRTSYENYDNIARPEELTDLNNNKKRDPGECFTDINANGVWDTNVGVDGAGGAQDVVIYKVTYVHKRIFPLWSFIGLSPDETIVAQTILRNQPFAILSARKGVTICA